MSARLLTYEHMLADSVGHCRHHAPVPECDHEEGRPYLCPVCEGRKTVPEGFYTGIMAGHGAQREECQACEGEGILIV